MPLTAELGDFVSRTRYTDLPPEAVETARLGFTDAIAVMMAGRNEESVRIVEEALAAPAGKSSIRFTGRTAPAEAAALINGTAAHALDFDDVVLRGHISAVLVPAILAFAEERDLSGEDMLLAYVVGYEVWAELAWREKEFHHNKGWHPTGILGPIAAAASCASLARLTATQAASALAIGASHASGLMANFGSMTKPLHVGRAAQAGIVSAKLAAGGFTASPDALEHPQGFLAAVSPSGLVDREAPSRAGTLWRTVLERLNIKQYPVCYCTHRLIDAALDLAEANDLKAADISSVEVTLSETCAAMLRNHLPQDGLAAKFSAEFAVAASVVARRVTLAELDDVLVRTPDMQALMKKVSVSRNTNYAPDSTGEAETDSVTIELNSGKVLAGDPVRRAKGHAERPLTREQILSKFTACADAGDVGADALPFFERLQALESQRARHLVGAA